MGLFECFFSYLSFLFSGRRLGIGWNSVSKAFPRRYFCLKCYYVCVYGLERYGHLLAAVHFASCLVLFLYFKTTTEQEGSLEATRTYIFENSKFDLGQTRDDESIRHRLQLYKFRKGGCFDIRKSKLSEAMIWVMNAIPVFLNQDC